MMSYHMRIMRRLGTVLLLVSLLLSVSVSCQTGDGTGESNGTDGTTANVKNVTLNGNPLAEYKIVYPWADSTGEKKIADKIQQGIQETFGVLLSITVDYDGLPSKAIAVGDVKNATITTATETVEENEWYLTADAHNIYLLAKTDYGFEEVLEEFLTAVKAASESKSISVSGGEKKSYGDKQITTMTFNIRNWDESYNHLQRIKKVIKNHTPDVIGFQEMSNKAGYEWVDKLLADADIAAMYAYIGESRADSTEEQAAIFYRKDKFTVVDSDTRWLYCTHGIQCTSSECKGADTAGNFSSELTYNRIFTYARLKRIVDGKEMTFINTHLESSKTMYDGVGVQVKEVDYIINFAKALIANGETVVITGDFNSGLNDLTCTKILSAGFQVAEQAAKKFVGKELPVGEKYASENISMTRGIDHIFISSPACVIETYTYCDQKISIRGEADYPSDHIPHIATCVIP